MSWDFGKVFTPNAPVGELGLLVGREAQLRAVRDAIDSRGAHPAVIGWRGVGKTSLVHHACEGHLHARINCSRDSTFDSLMKSALESAGFQVFIDQGIGKTWLLDETETGRCIRLKGTRLNLRMLYEIVTSLGVPISIVLDEYDQLPRGDDPKSMIGDLIKALSDHASEHQCTIVFIGISRSVATLLGAHDSIHRQIEEVWLPPLTDAHISYFLTEAQRLTEIVFDPQVREDLVQASRGLPYVTHLLGKESVLVATQRSDFHGRVTEQDLEKGKLQAIRKVYSNHLARFRRDLASLSEAEKHALRCLVSVHHASRDALTSAAKMNSEHKLLTPEEFTNTVHALVRKKLIYTSEKGAADVRFADPLLGPLLRMRLGAFRTAKKKIPSDRQMELPLFAGSLTEAAGPEREPIDDDADDGAAAYGGSSSEGIASSPRNGRVFVSYSHKDKRWLDQLRIHLRPLERDNLVDVWDDTRVRAGSDWRKEIAHAIREARAAVLLITADFLASEFITTDELPRLLLAAERGGTVVLPVIVGASQFENIPTLARFQAANSPSNPLNGMRTPERERVFVELGRQILGAVSGDR